MKTYVIRLSASGALCLSAIGCGANETKVTSLSASDTQASKVSNSLDEEKLPLDCDKLQKKADLEQYLNQLQLQGRLTDCDVEIQLINSQTISLPPDE